MTDEQRAFVNARLWALSLVEEIAREEGGDPAGQMRRIRLALGGGHFEETDDVTSDEHAELNPA